MPTVWGLHMPYEIGFTAVEASRVFIGWGRMGDLGQLPKDRGAIKAAIAQTYPDYKQGAIPVAAGVIYRFVHEIKAGDYLVYPSKHDRLINIGRFTGKFIYEVGPNDGNESYPNARPVEWLGHFPRSEFSQSTLYEMGAFITLFLMKDKSSAELVAKIDPTAQVDAQEEEDASPDDDAVSSSVTRQAEETAQDFVI